MKKVLKKKSGRDKKAMRAVLRSVERGAVEFYSRNRKEKLCE